MNSARKLAFGVVLLAAGRSQRMGRPKLLLPWQGTTVLGHLLRQWKRLGASQTAVVCGIGATEKLVELDQLRFPRRNRLFNAAPERGMFSSIQCAADWPCWQAGLTHFVLALGDQPHLRIPTLQALLDFAAAHPDRICQPLRNGRPRHPVLMPKPVFDRIKDTPATTLKAFLELHATQVAGFESGDVGLDLDLDTPEDYERVRREFGGEHLGS